MLYLNGLCNAFAPDINLMSEIAPVSLYFQTKYPGEIAAMGVVRAVDGDRSAV